MDTTDIQETPQSALSHRYSIECVVGEGGMATVYRAQDRKHDRTVAIKVLKPEVAAALGAERFLREINITAGLRHPHILPLFDSGEAARFLFYVMPFVEGESLRDRLSREKQLPLDDALRIACEVAEALSYAHSHGVIHRDLKPENILLEGAHAVVADFGIAKAITAAGGDSLTHTGVAVGTPLYMSPEQAAGEKHLDGRSDLYGLGCVLYEMLAGQPPFTGPTVESVIRQHLSVEAPPVNSLRPAVSVPWVKILGRVLSKAPADRFSTAADFAEALNRVHRKRASVSREPGDKLMLAVLPLDNFNRPDEDYFSDGLTEELITHIVRLSPQNLGVIARTTAMRYKSTDKTVADIGAELGVEYVLEGSARRAGDRARITVQLIKVDDQTHLWAESYDRRLSDIFDVQEEVGHKVARALEVKLLTDRSGVLAPVAHPVPAAYDAYLKGLHVARSFFVTKSPLDYERAVQLFQEALGLDPGFARPNAALARMAFEHYRDYGDEESLREADERAGQLLRVDPNSASARGTGASVFLWRGQKELAIREARIALELDPAEPAAREALGVAYYMSGLLSEGTEQFAAWRRTDPLAPAAYRRIVDGYIWTGNFQHARTLLEEALTLFPQSPVFRRHLARVHYETRDFSRAEEQLQKTLELEPYRGFEARAQLALVYARTGRSAEGGDLLTEDVLAYARRDFLESILYPAQFHALVGESSLALEWIRMAVAAGNENYAWFSRNPDFDPLRELPEFQALMASAQQASHYYERRYGSVTHWASVSTAGAGGGPRPDVESSAFDGRR
jgi:eukaryotic-like serine/threonine-protein kinase